MQSFEEWDQSDSFEIRESESAPVHRIVHTPGPWNAVQWQDDGHTYSHEVVGDNGEEVAGILKADDARLIAAAPDMYRLIRKCYQVLHMGVWEVDETDQEVCEQINDAMWNHFGDGWRPKADEVV